MAQSLPFGAQLKRLRRARGLTQEELAAHAGYSPIYVSYLERGARHPLASTVALLAEALDLTAEERSALMAASRPLASPAAAVTPAVTTTSIVDPAGAEDGITPGGDLVGTGEPAQRDLPTGTVTFLVTAIEDSAELVQRLGSASTGVLTRHQALLRAACVAHGGSEVDTQGDRFLFAFPTAPAALAAAAQAQRALLAEPWPEEVTLRVRTGLHSGAPLLVGDRYVGLDVHRAAGIAAAGHGGQVLLSAATWELVRDELPEGAQWRDLGEHRLTDLQRPERITQLLLPGLPATFSALRTLDARPHNLPEQLTPLLGRAREVAAVAALLRRDDVRLVTITGTGGTGKTRLGLQVAAEVLDAFPDGVWFVRLSRLVDPNLVIPTIAATLDLRESGSQPIAEVLRAALHERHLLLLLDNFEQVAAAAVEVSELLAACAGVRALVTSRVPLHVRGEKEYPLHPLPLPDPHHLPPPEQLPQYAAVALFIERARDVLPNFTITNASAPAVAEICARLDGLPLAIELAAAHVKLLPPPALLQRLERRLPLLVGGARDLDARQQTMWATLAWSEGLLSAAERRLFRRLAVFVGGGTLEAVEAICAVPDGAEPLDLDVLQGLGRLVDHSVVQQHEEEDGEPRFGLLQVIREYALEQLEASGEAEALRRAHAANVLALVERAEPELRGPEGNVWYARLEREHDNLRAALGWARERGEVQTALLLLAAAGWFWETRGHLREGRAWAEELLAQEELYGVSSGASPGAAGERSDVSASARALRVRARALYTGGRLALWLGEYVPAARWLEQAVTLGRSAGDQRTAAHAVNSLGVIAHLQGDLEQAIAAYEESLALFREAGDRQGIAGELHNLGYVVMLQGDLERAAACFTEALALGREAGDRQVVAMGLSNLGWVARRRGEVAHAEQLSREALALFWDMGDLRRCAEGLEELARTHGAAGQGGRSARLVGAAAALRETLGTPQPPVEWEEMEQAVAATRSALGEERWAAAYAAGSALPIDEAITEALSVALSEGD